MSPFPVNLVCPRCRTLDAHGELKIVLLEPCDSAGEDRAGGRCPGCGTNYPGVEDVHCVPPDPDAFRQAQAEALDPGWNGSCTTRESAALVCSEFGNLEPGSDSFREAFLPGVYAAANFPEGLEPEALRTELTCNLELPALLRNWLRAHPPRAVASAECALDVGCGPGRLLHELAPLQPNGCIGFDLRLSMLRLARRLADCSETFVPFRIEGRRFIPLRISKRRLNNDPLHFVQGDIISPPFEAEVFPLVSAVSLLDTVTDPLFALGQLDALVCPGGLLILATPYHWEPGATSPENWLSTAEHSATEVIRIALAGGHACLPHLDYEILEEEPFLPWVLPSHGRLVHRFFLDVILARKAMANETRQPPVD